MDAGKKFAPKYQYRSYDGFLGVFRIISGLVYVFLGPWRELYLREFLNSYLNKLKQAKTLLTGFAQGKQQKILATFSEHSVHYKENPIVYSFSGNCVASVPISTVMCVCVSDLYIPRIGPHISLQLNMQTDPGNI